MGILKTMTGEISTKFAENLNDFKIKKKCFQAMNRVLDGYKSRENRFKLQNKHMFTLNIIFGSVDIIQDGDGVSTRLSGAVFSSGENIPTTLCNWN